jgi:hypothetical protein
MSTFTSESSIQRDEDNFEDLEEDDWYDAALKAGQVRKVKKIETKLSNMNAFNGRLFFHFLIVLSILL